MLRIKTDFLGEINEYLLDPNNPLVNNLLDIIDEMGGVTDINRSAERAGKVQNLISCLDEKKSPFLNDLKWLIKKKDEGAFISIPDYRKKIFGDSIDQIEFNESNPVTLEISINAVSSSLHRSCQNTESLLLWRFLESCPFS